MPFSVFFKSKVILFQIIEAQTKCLIVAQLVKAKGYRVWFSAMAILEAFVMQAANRHRRCCNVSLSWPPCHNLFQIQNKVLNFARPRLQTTPPPQLQ